MCVKAPRAQSGTDSLSCRQEKLWHNSHNASGQLGNIRAGYGYRGGYRYMHFRLCSSHFIPEHSSWSSRWLINKTTILSDKSQIKKSRDFKAEILLFLHARSLGLVVTESVESVPSCLPVLVHVPQMLPRNAVNQLRRERSCS